MRLALSLRISSRLHPTTVSDALPSNILRGYSSLPPHYLRPPVPPFVLLLIAKWSRSFIAGCSTSLMHLFVLITGKTAGRSGILSSSLRASSSSASRNIIRSFLVAAGKRRRLKSGYAERKLVRYSLTRWINFSLAARGLPSTRAGAYNRRGKISHGDVVTTENKEQVAKCVFGNSRNIIITLLACDAYG